MRLAVLAAALLLAAPAGSAEPPQRTPFEVGPLESVVLGLHLATPGDVTVSITFQVGYARDLVLDGPGECNLRVSAGGGPSATVGHVRCRELAAGDHAFVLRMEAGYARGWLAASQGTWT